MPDAVAAEKMRVPKLFGTVEIRSDTVNESDRTVEVIWSTGAAVKRYSWDEGYYMEELSMEPSAIRLDRFAAGMSLLDSHDVWSMKSRLGTVVPGTVRIEGGVAYAVVKFSRNEAGEAIFRDLLDGHSIQISVGYRIHSYEKTESSEGSLPVFRAIDWEPMELSVVLVPADAGAHSRSSKDEETFVCAVTTQRQSTAENDPATTLENPMNKREAAKKYKGDQLDALAIGAGITRNADESDDALRARLFAAYDAEDRAASDAEAAAQAAAEQEAARTAAAGTQTRSDAPQGQTGQVSQAPTLSEGDAQRIAQDAVRADRTRQNEILNAARTAGVNADESFVRTALENGSSLEQFRSALLDHLVDHQQRTGSFPVVETRGMRDSQETTRSQVANAILHRHNVVADLMEGANEWRGMSAMDIARELIRMNGGDTRGSAQEIVQRALHSTSDFPIILGDITRQTLMAGYDEYANTFEAIAHRNIVTDFREVTALEMGKAPDLEKVNESGEFKRGTVKESSEGFRIESYGKILGLTRRMIINDQLGAFTRLIKDWGGKIGKLEGDIVWGVVIKNAKLKDGNPLFHASRGNLASPGTALDQANLEKGVLAFRQLKNLDGEQIKLSPNFLYTGTALSIEAERQTGAVFTPNTAAATIANTTRALTPVYEPRLDDINTKAFFLFAGNQQTNGRGLQYAYLAGHEQPRYEERIGFDVDGIEYKIAHDFGAGLTDFRFGYKNPGV